MSESNSEAIQEIVGAFRQLITEMADAQAGVERGHEENTKSTHSWVAENGHSKEQEDSFKKLFDETIDLHRQVTKWKVPYTGLIRAMSANVKGTMGATGSEAMVVWTEIQNEVNRIRVQEIPDLERIVGSWEVASERLGRYVTTNSVGGVSNS